MNIGSSIDKIEFFADELFDLIGRV